METIINRTFQIISALLFAFQITEAQRLPVEKIFCFTDRTLYLSGETIQFWASIIPKDSTTDINSKILYCDFISQNKNIALNEKFIIENHTVSEKIFIPGNIPSGNYYLRSYTKYMRNFNQENFSFILIKILNSKESTIVNPHKITSDSLIDKINFDSTVIHLSTNKKEYIPREILLLKIKNQTKQKFENLSITIVPEGSLNLKRESKPTHFKANHPFFTPENSGISISGKIINKTNGKTLAYNNIYLTEIGNKNMIPGHTDSTGRFQFTLSKNYGQKNIIFSTEKKEKEITPTILIDNDFEKIPNDLIVPAFYLSEKEQQIAKQMYLNQQINSLYNLSNKLKKQIITKNSIPFYGKPSEIFKFDDYIRLNSLSEYFTEIDGTIKLLKIQGKKQFQIKGTQSELYIYKPLLMLDWVVIQNAEDILALSPQLMSHIEIINAPYLRGEFIFGGIINFISKNNDFAGIKFPETTISIPFQFLSKTEPDYHISSSIEKNIPIAKNTVFWQPNLNLNGKEAKEIKTIIPDSPGNYIIALRGIDAHGNRIQSTKKIKVK